MIDALLPGMQGSNPGKATGKMDFTKKSDSADDCEGFSSNSIKGATFTDLYAKISNCNKQAQVNDSNHECPQNEEGSDCSDVNLEMLSEILGMTGNELLSQISEISGEVETPSGEISETGSELIKDALRSITELLGLPDRGLDKLDIKNADSSTVNELAEIVYAVEQITTALASQGNDSLVSQILPQKNSELALESDGSDTQTTSDLSSELKVELFKFQMGVQLLGISSDVQTKVAELSQQSPMTGLNQAVDPSTIITSVEQMKNVFGKALENIDSKEDNAVTVSTDGKNKIVLSDLVSDSQESDKNTTGVFDTKTYRTLLKVDAKEKHSDSAGDAKTDKKNELVGSLNVDAAILQDGKEGPELPDFSIATDVKHMKIEGAPAISQDKLSSALTRMADEPAVMEQISGKLTSVIRSGSNEVRIQLRPEALGEVSLRIKMEGDIVFAKIQVESQHVKEIVESNLQVLKDALASQNLSSGSIDVSVGRDGDNSKGWDLQQQHQQQQNAAGSQSGENLDKNEGEKFRNEHLITRIDTGNRYGTNSIEYYA
jgi:flagellar hook-length control protein FliK